jgi:predicted Zn-dependent peptidase
VLVGDLLADQASALAEELLAGWTATNAAVSMRPLPVLTGTGITSVHRAAARQCEVRFAATAPALHDPVFPALHLADQVFGGYFSARLAQNLRERRGWIYRRSPPPAATPWASGPS